MPSPVVLDPATSFKQHASAFPPASDHIGHDPRALHNTFLDVGANHHGSREGAPIVRDAIREGKEKARAVMAASGVNIGATPSSRPSNADGKAPSSDQNLVNGFSNGRKRSRSGSRKSLALPNADLTRMSATDEHGKYLSELYQARDAAKVVQEVGKSQWVGVLSKQFHALQDEFHRIEQPVGPHPQDLQRRLRDAADVYGSGFQGYGNGWTASEQVGMITYPSDPRRKWAGHKTRHDRRVRFNRTQIANQAEQSEDLVPIRLDIEHDKVKLRDTLTWNLHERIIEPRIFAETLVEDFKLPPEQFQFLTQEVLKTIHETVNEYYPHVFLEEQPQDPDTPYSANKNDDMRVVIKLNVTIGAHTLVDQFEWDINNPANDPEGFAKQMAKDMALSGEFTTAIAHQIREQIQLFTKSLYITGHPFDGRPIEDSDVRDNFLPSPLPSVFRPVQTAKDYMPFLYELNDDDLAHQEVSILREQRRQKRSVTRRGGPALPDLKDRERTVRSLVVSSVLPGAAETVDTARVFKYLRASRRGQRGNRMDGSESEEEESEESEIEEVVQVTGGTARTRGMRGAATAAQAAMKATLGRSQTPEIAAIHHHETRHTSRSLRHEIREDSEPEPTELIVKLKINPTKYRAWWQNYQKRPVQEGKWRYYPDGSVNIPDGHNTDDSSQNPPPPHWLREAIIELRKEFEGHDFDGWMKPLPADKATGHQMKTEESKKLPPDQVTMRWFPRIRCNDCPGKSYNARPDEKTENFKTHLKNKGHRERVEARLKKSNSSAA